MISYVVQPNRFYPEIKNIINQKYKIGDYSNHLIVNKTSKCFDYDSNEIKDINILDILKLKENCNFFCGVIHPKYIPLLRSRLVFTIIAHPVERIYDFFFLCKLIEEKTKNSSNNLIKILFKEENLTLENFINTIISNNLFKNTDIKIDEHITSIPKKFKNFDFVGISEQPESTINFFKKELNLDISNCNLSIRKNISSYKEEELTNLLSEEIELYNYFLNKTKNYV
jgi:hypothetical protein